MKLTPTHEQRVAVQAAKDYCALKLVAGAGCTKTTTLSMIANEIQSKSLYLAFNKAMVEEAKQKFPSWVTVKTTHSLAFAEFGVPIMNKLKRPIGKYQNVCGTGNEISRYFKIGPMDLEDGSVITSGGMGIAIKETLNRFEYSDDPKLASKHVSYSPVGALKTNKHFNKEYYEALVISYAQLLWEERIDPKSPILATHDTYLKLYQLSEPDLSQFEVIYLDEAQDTNDCVLSIIRNQKSKIIFVGDPNQQIYSWRGSVNAMAKVSYKREMLSTSFRFGTDIADIANVILNHKNTSSLQIKGFDQIESVTERFLSIECDSVAYLYRTNAVLISDAVDRIENGERVALEIDVADFTRKLESAIQLYYNNMKLVKHEDIVPFATWEDLVKESKASGSDLARIVLMVNTGSAQKVLNTLKSHVNPKNPSARMTTAHKSKGREFDVVVLADDFPDCYDQDGVWTGLHEMEQNLLYVAATRAKKRLAYNTTISQMLNRIQKEIA